MESAIVEGCKFPAFKGFQHYYSQRGDQWFMLGMPAFGRLRHPKLRFSLAVPYTTGPTNAVIPNPGPAISLSVGLS